MQSQRHTNPILGPILVLVLALQLGCGPDEANTSPKPADSQNAAEIPVPTKLDELVAEGIALWNAGRPEAALAIFAEAAAIDANDPRVQRGMRLQKVGPGRQAAAAEKLDEAEDFLFLGHDLGALGLLREARELNPNDQECEALYAGTCLKTRRFAEAFKIFDGIFRSDPLRLDAFLGRMESAYRAQDWDRLVSATDRLDQVVAANEDPDFLPRVPQARFMRGVALFSLYRFPEAIAALSKALAAAPTSHHIREYLASSYLEAGEFETAAKEFRSLIELAPTTALARYKLGKALDRQGKKAEAITQYRAELGMNRKLFQVAVECARCYDALGGPENLREALILLEDALKINPLSHDALFTLQAVQKKLGMKAEAASTHENYQKLAEFKEAREEEMRVFERQRKNDPNDTVSWLKIVEIRVRYSPPEEVLDEVRKLINAHPTNLDALYHASQLFLVIGENQSAWYEAAKLMDLAPNDLRGYAIGSTALLRLNRYRDAADLARRALVLDGTNGDALQVLVTALRRVEPDSKELKELLPHYERMLEEQARFEAELKKERGFEEILNR